MVYKVIIDYPDGTSEELDEVFETEEEASECGLDALNDYQTGGEVLYMSNPGDYPLNEDDQAEFRVLEVNGL